MQKINHEIIETFKKTPGAISLCEGVAIYWVIKNYCSGKDISAIDLGSNAGKSSIFAVYAFKETGKYGNFHMVDPVYDLNNRAAWAETTQRVPEEMPWNICREENFKSELVNMLYNIGDNRFGVLLYGDTSLKILPSFDNIDYVFIDSDDHQVELVDKEVKIIEDKVNRGGLVLFHDFENQYIGPRKAFEYLISTEKYEEIKIPWEEIKDFVGREEEGNLSWHMPGVYHPTFVGALRRI